MKINTTVDIVTAAKMVITACGLSKMLNPTSCLFVKSEAGWVMETGSGSNIISCSTSGVCFMLTKGLLLISSCSTSGWAPLELPLPELPLEELLEGLDGPVPVEPEPLRLRW